MTRRGVVYVSLLHMMHKRFVALKDIHKDINTRTVGFLLHSISFIREGYIMEPSNSTLVADVYTQYNGVFLYSIAETVFIVHITKGDISIACMFLDYVTRSRYKVMLEIGIRHLIIFHPSKVSAIKHFLCLAPEYALDSALSIINYCRPTRIPHLEQREYISALFCAVKRDQLHSVRYILNKLTKASYNEHKKLIVRAFFLSITRLRRGVFDEFIARGVDVNYPHKNTAYRVARDTNWHNDSVDNERTLAYMRQVLLGRSK